MAETLLEHGARVDDESGESGATPLNVAAAKGHAEVVQLLLAHGADRTKRSRWGVTPLEAAVRGGHQNVAGVLLEGAPAAMTGTLLYEAALKNQRDIADLLLRKGANANARDKSGATPLHAAALKGNLAVAELLLSRGAEVDPRDGDGLTPLHNAALTGNAGMAALLLDKGADREARDRETGATPLFQAAAWGRKAVVDLLLQRGADVNAKNLVGVSPVAAAEKNGFADIARVLRGRGGQ